MALFSAIFALWNIQVYICSLYSSNEIAYVEAPINETFRLWIFYMSIYIIIISDLGNDLITYSLEVRVISLYIYVFLIIASTMLELISVLVFFHQI